MVRNCPDETIRWVRQMQLGERERLRRAFLAMGQLKEPYRQVVHLRCLRHKGFEEIASMRWMTIERES